MTRLCTLLALLVVAGACSRSRPPGSASDPPTLCVQNAAAAVGMITAELGPVTWRVEPGQTQCKPISAAIVGLPLRAVSFGGGLRGPVLYQAQLPGLSSTCWHWRLTDSSTSQTDLAPCEERQQDTTREAPRGA